MASTQYPDLTNDDRDQAFKKLKSDQENNRCIDCEKKNTKWASIHLGLFLCIDCAGKHRAWGPSFSLVRSMTLDSWNQRYLTFLEKGGNQNFLEFIRKFGLALNNREIDYKNSVIQQYKAYLGKIVDEELVKHQPVVEKPVQQQPQQQQQQQQLQQQQSQQQQQQQVEQKQKKEEEEFQNNFLNNQPTKVKSQQVVFKSSNNNQKANQKKPKAELLEELNFDELNFDQGIDAQEQANVTTKQSAGNNDFKLFEEEFPDYVPKKFEPVNNYVPSEQQLQQLEKMKKENVKSISSETIFNSQPQNQQEIKQNYGKFHGAQAISSKAFFGQPDDEEEEDQPGEKLEQLKNLFWTLKDTASDYIDKLKNKK